MLARAQHVAVIAFCVVAACSLGCIGWAAYQVGASVQENRQQVFDTVHDFRAGEHAIIKALVDKGRPNKPETMGAIPAIKFTALAASNAIVATETQAQQVTPHAIAAMDTLKDASARLGNTADSLTGTAQQGTQTLKAGETTLTAFQAPLKSLTRFADSGNQAMVDLDSLFKLPAIPQTIDNIQQFTLAGAATMGDVHVWSHAWLNPDPCKTKRCKAERIFNRVGGYLGLASDARNFSTFWNPIGVKIKK